MCLSPIVAATANLCRAPDAGKLPPLNVFTFLNSGIKFSGSAIGSPAEINEMLQFAADNKVKPWVECRSLKEANQVVQDMTDGKARYRYVLVNEKHTKRESLL